MKGRLGIIRVFVLIGAPVQAITVHPAGAGSSRPPLGGGQTNYRCPPPATELISQHVYPQGGRQALCLPSDVAQVLPVPVRQQQHNTACSAATTTHQNGGQAARGRVHSSHARVVTATAARARASDRRRAVHLMAAEDGQVPSRDPHQLVRGGCRRRRCRYCRRHRHRPVMGPRRRGISPQHVAVEGVGGWPAGGVGRPRRG